MGINHSLVDDTLAAKKRKLKQDLIEEYETRLKAFRQYKLKEANKLLNAEPFKCQACTAAFSTKGLDYQNV